MQTGNQIIRLPGLIASIALAASLIGSGPAHSQTGGQATPRAPSPSVPSAFHFGPSVTSGIEPQLTEQLTHIPLQPGQDNGSPLLPNGPIG